MDALSPELVLDFGFDLTDIFALDFRASETLLCTVLLNSLHTFGSFEKLVGGGCVRWVWRISKLVF